MQSMKIGEKEQRKYENGNLKSETEYENGLKNGVAKLYSEDGKLIREIKYKKGEMEVK